MNEHGCGISWCKQGPTEASHWCTIAYTPATMGTVRAEDIGVDGVSFPTVGIGIRWDESTGVPAVVVHISGGSIDVDAYMRPDEAGILNDALDDANNIVRETLAGGCRDVVMPAKH